MLHAIAVLKHSEECGLNYLKLLAAQAMRSCPHITLLVVARTLEEYEIHY
jgi:hypothetical protein